MIILFYILAALLVLTSYKSFRGGIDYLNYFKKQLGKPAGAYRPYVSVIAPCKGVDRGLEQNVEALLAQNYADFEVIFVVDDESDPAAELIRRKIGEDPKTQLVIAQKTDESSQKIENLREGVLHVSEHSEAFIFVDSDIRPAANWLRNLVAPLADVTTGAATGYRWFISESPGLASELRSVWNASVASALGPNTSSNFCWGGSTAIRREVFEKLGIGEKWRGKLSDDFALTRILNEAGMPIVFVPQALSASVENCSFRELIEFTTRQMKITRVYSPRLWLITFLGTGIFNFVLIAAFLIIVLSRDNNFAVWFSIVTIFLVAALSVGKAWLRLRAVRYVLSRYDPELRRQSFFQCTLWLFSPALFFYNCAAALLSRRLTWRGICYELVSPNETRVVGPAKLISARNVRKT